MLLSRQNTPGALPAVGYTPTRGFFGLNKKEETVAEEEKKAPKEDGDKTAETNGEGKQEAAQAEGSSDQKEEKKSGDDGKEETEDSVEEVAADSGKKEGSEDVLSAKDIKRIKSLFNEQEEEIKNLEA